MAVTIYSTPHDGTACLRLSAVHSVMGGINVELLVRIPLVGGFEARVNVPVDRWPEGVGRWEAGATAMPGRRPNVPDVVVRGGFNRDASDVPVLWKNIP